MRWRAFAALPPDAPWTGAEVTALSDVAPTLARVAILTSWAACGFGLLWRWRRDRVKPRRLPIPARYSWICVLWLVYFFTRQLAHVSTVTNAENATAWAWDSVSWGALCVSWGIAYVVLPRCDRVVVPPGWSPTSA
jgi:hypothetical protein